MEENIDGKSKITPSIPANYVSILQLRERWINERKRKEEEEEEERRRKQQAEEQQMIEEDLKKLAEVKAKREDLDEKRLNRNNRKHQGRNSKKEESLDGGEAEKEEPEVTAAIGSERGEDAGVPESKRRFRKRYDSRKKKNQNLAATKEDVVDECGSIAPPEYAVTENHTPVKDAILVYRKKGENATGKKNVESTVTETQFENPCIKNLKAKTRSSKRNGLNQRHDLRPQRVAVEDDVVECGTENHTPVNDRVYRKKGEKATGKLSVGTREKAIETQFEDLSIKSGEEKGETKNLKAQTSRRNRNRIKQIHDLPPRRVIGDATMVWVKKEQNEKS
ncbi:vicilin-like seed storage protein At2g18540 [Eutrema salsugineum]|uniref:vicilin-like seed storage protein At2g18540 n=1 Tax=Eutrema salsugineum TaxID=72664 RepID=UPI000CED781A|nr:vicilin-like seed storage protein At2g18540 [Eutrema salsugineum]